MMKSRGVNERQRESRKREMAADCPVAEWSLTMQTLGCMMLENTRPSPSNCIPVQTTGPTTTLQCRVPVLLHATTTTTQELMNCTEANHNLTDKTWPATISASPAVERRGSKSRMEEYCVWCCLVLFPVNRRLTPVVFLRYGSPVPRPLVSSDCTLRTLVPTRPPITIPARVGHECVLGFLLFDF